MTQEVFDLAKTMGNTPDGEDDALRLFCDAALTHLTARLKPDLSAEACAPALRAGAAWLALADLHAARGGAAKFSAGQVTVEQDRSRAQQLRAQARQVMRPYVRDEGFSFLGVRG